MGIPSCRFVDKVHEEFTCPICIEVAIDPVLINDCQHISCRKCIDGSELAKCPTCQVSFKDPKWKEMEGLNQRVYLALEVKCLNPSCKDKLDVKTYSGHDGTCPITFDFCLDCGYKFRRGSSGVHSCSQQIRLDQLQSELDEMKQEEKKSACSQQVRFGLLENQLLEERKRFIQQQVRLDRQQVQLDQLKNQLMEEKKLVNEQGVRMTEELAAERKRTEHLIMVCISYRQNFSDWNSAAPNFCEAVRALRDGHRTANLSVTNMKKILEEINKH